MPRLRRLIRELHRQREETRQLLCRLLRELQQRREETRRQREEARQLREEVQQLRADSRRPFIRELLVNFALTIFGGLISGLLLHWWLEGEDDPAFNAQREVRGGKDVSFTARRRHDVRSGPPQNVRVVVGSLHQIRGEARVVVVPASVDGSSAV